MITKEQYDDIQFRLIYARLHQHTPQLFIDYYLHDVEMLLNQAIDNDGEYVQGVVSDSQKPA